MDHEAEDDNLYGVMPENWPIVEAFIRCQTQWVYGAMGGVVGLNYVGVEVVLRQYNVTDPEVFPGLQIMELAALKVMNHASK